MGSSPRVGFWKELEYVLYFELAGQSQQEKRTALEKFVDNAIPLAADNLEKFTLPL